jgi:hypothetical protein
VVSEVNDLQELRAVLQAKADEVQPHRVVPPALVRRARRRIVRTAVVSSVIVLALGVGAAAGVRAITGPPGRQIPGHSPTPPAPVGPQACRATDLAAALRVEGAAGSQYLTVTFTNGSAIPCTMEGVPQVQVQDAGGNSLPTQLGTQPAQWQGGATPTPPPGWPVVTLPPGASAISVMRWTDECDTQGATRLVLDLGGEQISLDHPGSPPCVSGPGATAQLFVGPVEPTPVP